jgi:HEAT repeat protein
MLAMEKAKGQPFSWDRFFTWPALAPKLALASVMLIAGLLSGYFLSRSAIAPPNKQIETLSQQVSDLQEMMMLSLLEKESATDRLKAVNLTQEMGEASLKVTNALIKTLNSDENVNVRLAALDALRAYARNGEVRAALIRSIAQQRSPLVQISMAELMADLQEKSAVKEFDKIVSSNKTPAEVKKKIKESIKVLI